jgi:hypothetical protein
MAKLNESKKNERALQNSLEGAQHRCMEWEGRANEPEQLAMSGHALQDTADQLEARVEIANSAKLDAEEQLFDLQADKSPSHLRFPRVPSAIDHGNRQVSHQRSDCWAVVCHDRPSDSRCRRQS